MALFIAGQETQTLERLPAIRAESEGRLQNLVGRQVHSDQQPKDEVGTQLLIKNLLKHSN